VLKITTSDSAPLILTPEVTPPLVYLDTCVIRDLACKKTTGERFQGCLLDKGGTLYLSWAHLVELFGLGVGPTYRLMQSYLVSFGTSFVLIDSNARAVIDREKNWTPGNQNPAFDEELLRCLAANWRMSELSMAMLLDTVADQPGLIASLQTRHKKHKQELKAAFDEARNKYRTDIEWCHRLDNVTYSYTGSNAPTEYVYGQIVRECITTHEHFVPSDSLDFEHCVVPLAYCDYVVLDKKWTRPCRKIHIPPGGAAVFSVVEIDDLVCKIAS
jgi:hypothetical protein